MRPGHLGISALVLLFGVHGAVAQISDNEEMLDRYEKQLHEQRSKLRSLGSREESLLGELKRISQSSEKISNELTKLRFERAGLDQRVDQTNKEISRLMKNIHNRKGNVADRLRDLYMWGVPDYFKVLVAAETPSDFRQRRFLVRRWINHDRELIGTYRKLVADLSLQRRILEEDFRAREKLIRNRNKKEQVLRRKKKNRGQLLTLVRTQQDYYEKSIEELQEAARDLERLIETLRARESEGDSLFARMRGKLLRPVRGKVEKKFGPYRDPRLQAKLHHKGIDFRARKGAPIVGVFDGKVAYAGWFVGYGKILIVDHGSDYFTLYAHASRLLKKEGDAVMAGETIAEVGDTGSLKGTYLYFELRHKGVSKNPMPWFVRR